MMQPLHQGTPVAGPLGVLLLASPLALPLAAQAWQERPPHEQLPLLLLLTAASWKALEMWEAHAAPPVQFSLLLLQLLLL
jgi:hypothetical protein